MRSGASKALEFQRRLLRWYRKGRRRFAWRSSKATAYSILVSELLLRKTGTATVSQEYDRFIRRYPSPAVLAAASADEISGSIRRLGIADRGRLFKALGQQLVSVHSGHVPRSLHKLMALPGVGRYTASAVLCFAYRQGVPIVDTNVIRVLDRVFSLRSTKSRPRTDSGLWQAAASIVPKDRPVAYNRAMLDFAAAICTDRKPKCEDCPMASICDFYEVQTGSSRRGIRGTSSSR
jgi:A/G-specific adenine glycosylase